MSAGSAARAAEGGGHCNDPCFSALTEGGKEGRGARESSNEYTPAKRIITFTPSMYSDDRCQGFRQIGSNNLYWLNAKRPRLVFAKALFNTHYRLWNKPQPFQKTTKWNLITLLVTNVYTVMSQ